MINSDFTFNNKVYSKDKKQVLYKTNGTIEPEDGRKMIFYNFLLFSDHNESDMVFSKPDIGASTAYWEKPEDSKGVLEIEFNVYNYIFTKIE
ncbi:hypothetical protein ACFOEQ_20045 [Chryseobacterium arachidis]